MGFRQQLRRQKMIQEKEIKSWKWKQPEISTGFKEVSC